MSLPHFIKWKDPMRLQPGIFKVPIFCATRKGNKCSFEQADRIWLGIAEQHWKIEWNGYTFYVSAWKGTKVTKDFRITEASTGLNILTISTDDWVVIKSNLRYLIEDEIGWEKFNALIAYWRGVKEMMFGVPITVILQ